METFNPFVVKALESNLKVSGLKFVISSVNPTTMEVIIEYSHKGVPLYLKFLSPKSDPDIIENVAGFIREDMEEWEERAVLEYNESMSDYIMSSLRHRSYFQREDPSYSRIARFVWELGIGGRLEEHIDQYASGFEEFPFQTAYEYSLDTFVQKGFQPQEG